MWIGFSAGGGVAAGPAPPGRCLQPGERCQNWLPEGTSCSPAALRAPWGPLGSATRTCAQRPHSYVCELRPGCAGPRVGGWEHLHTCCPGQEPGSPPHLASTAAPAPVQCSSRLGFPCLDWARSRVRLSPRSLNPWALNTLLPPWAQHLICMPCPRPCGIQRLPLGAPSGDPAGAPRPPAEQQERRSWLPRGPSR